MLISSATLIWIVSFLASVSVTVCFRVDIPFKEETMTTGVETTTDTIISSELFKKNSRAQWYEDSFLYDNYFYNHKNGVIVESGALDGLTFSTSWTFDKLLNWTPVHVEGSPLNYANLTRHRPDALNANVALCSHPGKYHYIQRKHTLYGHDINGVAGSVDGILEFMPDKFIKSVYFSDKYKSKTSKDGVFSYTGLDMNAAMITTIDCTRFSNLMHFLHVKKIDLWVLDVEGGELNVLQGTDFTRLDISVILMETAHTAFAAHIAILSKNGFTCTNLNFNHVCVHKSFTPSVSPKGRYAYEKVTNMGAQSLSQEIL